jgi:hypothetical protein
MKKNLCLWTVIFLVFAALVVVNAQPVYSASCSTSAHCSDSRVITCSTPSFCQSVTCLAMDHCYVFCECDNMRITKYCRGGGGLPN